jgi:glycine/D-amino acid oxidase-like deaminating enzyme
VLTLADRFVKAGGTYMKGFIQPPAEGGNRLDEVHLSSDEVVKADRFVFAAGPWLPKLFPQVIGPKILPTRQEVFYFASPSGDRRYLPGAMPGWADFNGGDIFYGFPDLEGRGFKIAHDRHGPPMDPDTGNRLASPGALAEARAFMARRFPDLARRPLNEARVCQYENSSNGDFLIDRHPDWANVVLVGGGSGHGFKHGPAVGRYAAALAMGELRTPEPRFSLATKAQHEARAVH